MTSTQLQWNGDAALAAMREAVDDGVNAAALIVTEETRKNLRRTSYPSVSKPGGMPSRDSGALARSVNSTPARNGSALVGTNLKYAKMLEFGGVITPKTAKYLTVPLDREEFRRVRRQSHVLRNNPNIFVLRSKKGNLILMHRKSKGRGRGNSTPIAVLKKSVAIQPRPWLLRSMKMAAKDAQAAFRRRAEASFKSKYRGLPS